MGNVWKFVDWATVRRFMMIVIDGRRKERISTRFAFDLWILCSQILQIPSTIEIVKFCWPHIDSSKCNDILKKIAKRPWQQKTLKSANLLFRTVKTNTLIFNCCFKWTLGAILSLIRLVFMNGNIKKLNENWSKIRGLLENSRASAIKWETRLKFHFVWKTP